MRLTHGGGAVLCRVVHQRNVQHAHRGGLRVGVKLLRREQGVLVRVQTLWARLVGLDGVLAVDVPVEAGAQQALEHL